MIEEVLEEAAREIAAKPGRYVAEVIQAALLVTIVAWAGRRFLGKRLAARRARIAADLAEAEDADRESVRMRDEGRTLVARAGQEAPGIVQAAHDQVEEERAAAAAQLELDLEDVLRQARQTVAADQARIVRDGSERLVRLTAETARRYLDEMLTERERRGLTEKVILEALQEMERGSPRARSEPKWAVKA